MWEDKPNIGGGRFLLRVKKQYSNLIWEDLILSFIGKINKANFYIFLGSKSKETSNICGI